MTAAATSSKAANLEIDLEDTEVQVTELPRSSKGAIAALDLDADGACQAGDDADDILIQEVSNCAPSVRAKAARVPAKRRRRGACSSTKPSRHVTTIESGSDSSSSGSSSSRRRKQCVGAAAATALLSLSAPLDIDEADRVIEKNMTLPTSFAARWQHEGGMVAIMAELNVNISVLPLGPGTEDSNIHVAGTAHAVGRATSQIELEFQNFTQAEKDAKERAERQHMAEVEIPTQFMSAVGPNGADLPKVRHEFGGVMIALMPPKEAGGPLVAHIGPGTRQQVIGAKDELNKRLLKAKSSQTPAANVDKPAVAVQADQADLGDAFNELMKDVQPHIEAKN